MLPRPATGLHRPARVGRRSALQALAAVATGGVVLAASGCGADDTTRGAVARARSRDADTALVDQVVAQIRDRLAEVVETRGRVRALRAPLRSLEELHRAHLDALAPQEPTPESLPPARPPASAGVARSRARLLRREASLQQVLRGATLDAGSGALARLLAASAAGLAAHLAQLTGDLPAPLAPSASVTVTGSDDTTVSAWQEVLDAEHAAVYLLGVLGARTSESATPELLALLRISYVEHRDRRDDLVGQVAGAGAVPRAAATAYEVPAGLETAAGVNAAAVALEQATATSYAALVAGTADPARGQALDWLENSSIRVLGLRGTPEMFPGAGEHADR